MLTSATTTYAPTKETSGYGQTKTHISRTKTNFNSAAISNDASTANQNVPTAPVVSSTVLASTVPTTATTVVKLDTGTTAIDMRHAKTSTTNTSKPEAVNTTNHKVTASPVASSLLLTSSPTTYAAKIVNLENSKINTNVPHAKTTTSDISKFRPAHTTNHNVTASPVASSMLSTSAATTSIVTIANLDTNTMKPVMKHAKTRTTDISKPEVANRTNDHATESSVASSMLSSPTAATTSKFYCTVKQ